MDKSPHKIKLVFYAYPSGLLNTFKVLLIYYEKLARQKKMYDFFKNYYIAVRGKANNAVLIAVMC